MWRVVSGIAIVLSGRVAMILLQLQYIVHNTIQYFVMFGHFSAPFLEENWHIFKDAWSVIHQRRK